jgi:hypothetical protein
MIDFLVDNIYVVIGEKVFEQSAGIAMGTHCAPLLADLHVFLCSYEAEFVQKSLVDKKQQKTKTLSFNHTHRYFDDVLLINNQDFHNYVHLINP